MSLAIVFDLLMTRLATVCAIVTTRLHWCVAYLLWVWQHYSFHAPS